MQHPTPLATLRRILDTPDPVEYIATNPQAIHALILAADAHDATTAYARREARIERENRKRRYLRDLELAHEREAGQGTEPSPVA